MHIALIYLALANKILPDFFYGFILKNNITFFKNSGSKNRVFSDQVAVFAYNCLYFRRNRSVNIKYRVIRFIHLYDSAIVKIRKIIINAFYGAK